MIAEPSRELINQIADRMSQPIPKPAKPIPRPTKSWRRLKVGQVLKSKTQMIMGGNTILERDEFQVIDVDSLGVGLISLNHPTVIGLRWERTDWPTHWTLQQKKKLKRKKRTEDATN